MCPCEGLDCRLCARDPRHGTPNGYTNLRCHCEPCRAANAAYMYDLKLRRIARNDMPERLHGTPDGYGNWGCRCIPCTKAHSKDVLDRAQRAKVGLTDCGQGVHPKPKYRRSNDPRRDPNR